MVGGLLLVVLTLSGSGAGAWLRTGFSLSVLVAGLIAALAAAVPSAWRVRPRSPWPAVEVAASVVAATLAGLHLVEVAADLPSGRTTTVAALFAMLLAAVATALLAIAVRRMAPIRRYPAADLAALGGAMAVVAVGVGLVAGDRSLGLLTSCSLAATLAAATAVLVTESRRGGFAATALSILGAAVFAALTGAFARANFGRADQAFFVLHAAGFAVVAIASVRALVQRRDG
jgi:hypothetical protein